MKVRYVRQRVALTSGFPPAAANSLIILSSNQSIVFNTSSN
jgi:hypothetical protein